MAGETETKTEPDTKPDGLSQERVNEIVTQRVAQATEKANKDFLSAVGLSSVDEIKQIAAAHKAHLESQRTAEEQNAALLMERDALKVRADSSEASVRALLDAEIAAVDEKKRPMIPDFGDASKTLAWITANRAALHDAPAPANAGGGGSPGLPGGAATVTYEEWQKLNLTKRAEFRTAHPEVANQFSKRLQEIPY